jgi:hypothetical protein
MYVTGLGGMTQMLQMTVDEVYTPDCAADLGDARCDLELAALEESGSVAKGRVLRPGRIRPLSRTRRLCYT